MQYYYEDEASIYFLRLLSFEYEYHVRVSQKIGEGLSILKIQNFNNFDSSVTEVIYARKYNYNQDLAFFENYLEVL